MKYLRHISHLFLASVFLVAFVIGFNSATLLGHASAASTTNCFAHPGSCGYPDPTTGNVGPTTACASLTSSGSITAKTNGQTIQNLNINGTITVQAANVTINNVCVVAHGGSASGSSAIWIAGNANGTTIKYANVGGANTTNDSVQEAVVSQGGSTTIDHSYLHNCGECVHDSPFTITESYINADGEQLDINDRDHYEDIYTSDGTISIDHSVLLNPEPQTATVFADTNGGNGGACENHITINNSLLAGGGYMIYPCSASSSSGSSKIVVTNNRFARCITGPMAYNSNSGGSNCQNKSAVYPTDGATGVDQYGYWPKGGYFGLIGGPSGTMTWSGNAWDDNCKALDSDANSGAADSCPATTTSTGTGGGGTTTPPTGGATYHSADLTNLLSHYGQTSGMTSSTGDLNGDGAVNLIDLSKMLSSYSP